MKTLEDLRIYLTNKELLTKFFNGVSKLEGQFGEMSLRFTKGYFVVDLLCLTFPLLISDERDSEGKDITYESDETRISVKSAEDIFKPVKKTALFILKNSIGAAAFGKKNFDYIIIVKTKHPYRIAVADFETCKEFSKASSGGETICEVPFDRLVFINDGKDFLDIKKKNLYDLKEEFRKFRLELCKKMLC